MATKMDLPMLSVNPCKMSNIDSSNVGSLANVWNVFHKCAHSLEDGPRLENRCWRILSRQTLPPSNPSSQSSSPSQRKDVAPPSHLLNSSQLSQRLQSVKETSTAIEDDSSHESSSPSQSKMQLASSQKAMPVLNLEKMVSGIQQEQQLAPLSASIADAVPKPASATPETDSSPEIPPKSLSNTSHRSSNSSTSTAPPTLYESDRSIRPSIGSDTSVELLPSSNHSIVRGFSMTQQSSSYRSSSNLAAVDATSKALDASAAASPPKSKMFQLGGSSGEDDGSSFDNHMQAQAQASAQSQSHQSELSAGLNKSPPAKKLSFRDVVGDLKAHENSAVFESDDDDDDEEDDDDDISDGAIDSEDDDEVSEDEWEDEGDELPHFHRIDSKPELKSRRSLITTGLNQQDRANAFQEEAIKAQTSALKRSKTSSNIQTQEEVGSSAVSNGLAVPQKPIMRTRSDLMSLVSSPKTTRRNMLSTEINEDLRKSILHERLQKKSTINAYNKRVQSARNLPSLAREFQPMRDDTDYYERGIGVYHQTGW